MYSFPPLTCSYLALVSASMAETSSPPAACGLAPSIGASSATAVATAAGGSGCCCCWRLDSFTSASWSAWGCGWGRRERELLLLPDLAMRLFSEKGWDRNVGTVG